MSTDFKELFFEHKIVPKIEGEPSFTQLHKLNQILKANACSVPCTLGGGANGYIGMIVSDATYASLKSGTPFITPVHPGILAITANAT